jgi:hypothetical protein
VKTGLAKKHKQQGQSEFEASMGFFDRLGRTPSEDKFAQLMMKMLREVGDQRQASYDKAEFRLTLAEDGEETATINLRNLYIEYCGKPASERAAFLRRSCIGFAKQFDVPEEFEDAKHDLLPALVRRRCPK